MQICFVHKEQKPSICYDLRERGRIYRMPQFSASGVCPVTALEMSGEARNRLERLCPSARTVQVYLFPYYAGARPGNLSLYARGRDYHAVIRDALQPEADALRAAYPENRFLVLADASPIPEVRAAALAGLGAIGENGLLIHETYGSYVFIGTVVTDLALPGEARPVRACLRCGRCKKACPGGALRGEGVCLSALTQQGGALTAGEEALLRKHPLIWGCDLCQLACPMNENVPLTDAPPFREGLIDSLAADALEGLTRRAFAEEYPERAFTWRGPAPLRRNLAIKAENEQ